MKNLDLTSIARMALILGHLLAFAVAAAASAMTDYAIFARARVYISLLRKAATSVTLALAVLWIPGFSIIWLDTKFDLNTISHAPKLLAKLTIVSLLTLSAIALHRLAFLRFEKTQDNPGQAACLPAVLSAVSSTTWPFADFLGIAKAVAPLLGYFGFMALYLISLSCAISIALLTIQPRLARRMGRRDALSRVA
jgi:hypothetical protein